MYGCSPISPIGRSKVTVSYLYCESGEWKSFSFSKDQSAIMASWSYFHNGHSITLFYDFGSNRFHKCEKCFSLSNSCDAACSCCTYQFIEYSYHSPWDDGYSRGTGVYFLVRLYIWIDLSIRSRKTPRQNPRGWFLFLIIHFGDLETCNMKVWIRHYVGVNI